MSMIDKYLMSVATNATERAAIACLPWIGRGNEKSADNAAVNSMRDALNNSDIRGVVVIGEGERDKAPMLHIGEIVGSGSSKYELDIALDPLEGTTICATAGSGAMTVIALARRGDLLHAPDVYMEKIVVSTKEEIVDLDTPLTENLRNLAKFKKCSVSDLTVAVLQRSRHSELIAKIRESGARVQLITDGDIAAAISVCTQSCNVDMYVGSGGAPEGVLAAAALKSLGGQIIGRLLFDSDDQETRARHMGIADTSRKYTTDDMVKGSVIFAATGVTDGPILNGVRHYNGLLTTSSVVMNSALAVEQKIIANYGLARL